MPTKKASAQNPALAPASKATRPAQPKKYEITPPNMIQAIADLEINVPIMRTRVVGNRIELSLYGGRVHYWPETPAERKIRRGPPPTPPEPDVDTREPDEWHKPLPASS